MKGAAYARYSTDNQTDNSIAYQMEKIQSYCNDHGIQLCAFYTDEAQSGTNTNRAGFKNLVAAAHRKEFGVVVIYDITRGSRDVGDWFRFRKEMMQLGIQVISATQKLGDFTDPGDFLTELIMTGLGQHSVLDSRKKSIEGVAVRAKQGQFLGGTAPLGYDIQDGRYVINPAEAECVKTIFRMYSSGRSYNDILDALDGAKGKRGRPIGKNSLHSILTNERYIGVYTWNKRKVKLFRQWAGGAANPNCVRLEGIIPPIIDNITWLEVKKRMQDNKRRACNKAKRTYLLSGLIECESCGATYVGHTSTNKKGYTYTTYVCGNKYRTRSCDSDNIKASEIEPFVVLQLQQFLLELDINTYAEQVAEAFNSAGPDLSSEKAELNQTISKIDNGVKAILSGMDLPELQEEIDRLRGRKGELEELIRTASSGSGRVNPKDIEKMIRGSVDDWDDEHLAEIIRRHITKIDAHADGTFTVNIGVHINGCGGRI